MIAKRMGRPPDAGESRDARVFLRVTPSEKATYAAAAEVFDTDLSEWAREVLNAAAEANLSGQILTQLNRRR